MSNIIQLSAEKSGYRFYIAATGTIYLYKGEKKIRIGDHEPNDSLNFMRGAADVEIYTKGASGEVLLRNEAEICEKLTEVLEDFQLTPAAKAAITRNDKVIAAAAQLALQAQAQSAVVANEVANFQQRVNEVVAANKEAVAQMLSDADEYSKKGSNGDKRRKLRRSHFARAFEAAFGFQASPGDIKL
jgi:hypothetical protein